MRKIKPIDPMEFADVEDISRITIKGEMRKIYDEIHRKLTVGGYSAKDVVELLAKQGIQMTVELFRVYLRDLDSERGYKRSTKQVAIVPASEIKVFVPAVNSLLQIANSYSINSSKKEQHDTAVRELTRPEGITDAAWKDIKVQHLVNKHKLNNERN